ncbi:unnamed protein product [Spodoptera exigua]|nr:unnamed protein product [Spodoptera exigua]
MVHLRVAHFGFLSGNSNYDAAKDKSSDANSEQLDEKLTHLERNDNKQWQCEAKLHMPVHNVTKRLHFNNRIINIYSITTMRSLTHVPTVDVLLKNYRHFTIINVFIRVKNRSLAKLVVSQRTHKCQAQPPGTVVRQAGELVEKLKLKHIESDCKINDKQVTAIENLTYTDVSEANAELVRTGAKLSLEDMESEHFSLIAENFNEIGDSGTSLVSGTGQDATLSGKSDDVIFNQNIEELIDAIPMQDKSIPSPSEIMKNLCLSKDDDYIEILQTSNEGKPYEICKDFNVFL